VDRIDLIIEALTEASHSYSTDQYGVDYYACCCADIEFGHLDDCIMPKALDAAKELKNEWYISSTR
jgi:hypothetical protein